PHWPDFLAEELHVAVAERGCDVGKVIYRRLLLKTGNARTAQDCITDLEGDEPDERDGPRIRDESPDQRDDHAAAKQCRQKRSEKELQAIERGEADGYAARKTRCNPMRRCLYPSDAMAEIDDAPAPAATRPEPSARSPQEAGPLAWTEQP